MTDDVPRPYVQPTEPLRQLMTESWLPLERPRPREHPASGLRAERRRRLAEAFPGELLVVPTGSLKVRANDTTYPFRPGTAFTWLVGSQALDAVLVVHPDGRSVLYQPAPQSRDEEEWYTTYHGERMDGPREPLDEVAVRLRVDVLPVKDAWEVEQLQDAVDATVRGFEDVVRDLDKAVATSERYLEGRFFLRARVDGNDVGYSSICASGANACILHHVRNDGPVSPGDLLLLDMGVENRELYTADITRTLPVSGRFTERQRWMYTLVYEAQEAALAELRPDVP